MSQVFRAFLNVEAVAEAASASYGHFYRGDGRTRKFERSDGGVCTFLCTKKSRCLSTTKSLTTFQSKVLEYGSTAWTCLWREKVCRGIGVGVIEFNFNSFTLLVPQPASLRTAPAHLPIILPLQLLHHITQRQIRRIVRQLQAPSFETRQRVLSDGTEGSELELFDLMILRL